MAETYSVPVASVRLVREHSLYSEKKLDNPDAVIELLAEEIKTYDRETLCVVNVDGKNRPINVSQVSIGSLNASIASPREIFKTAVLSNAAGLFLMHNHPSGDTFPSAEDINTTRRVEEAGKLMDIPLRDHLIVAPGSGKYFSFHAEGLL